MNSKIAQKTLQCVNCSISLKRLKRRWMGEETEELVQLLTEWTCKELENNDAVCIDCYYELHKALESENKSRKFGHKSVCLPCGRSLYQGVRSYPLSADRQEHKLVIAQWTPSHQVKRLERVCTKCWAKAYHTVGKQSEAHSISREVQVKIEPIDSLLALGDGELNIPASPELQSEEETLPDKHLLPYSISMDTYKRAAGNSARCIFKNCNQKDWLRPPRSLIHRLLIDYSYYIPPAARICKHHKINSHKIWRKLVDDSEITDFNVAHLENVCSILSSNTCNTYCRNFESQIKCDDFLCQYMLGVSYKRFEKMLKDIQPIKKTVWSHKKGLSMYLMKKHTGFSCDKVAKFFGVRLKVLVNILHRIHTYLQTLVATDDSYVAVPTIVSENNKEEIVYYRV